MHVVLQHAGKAQCAQIAQHLVLVVGSAIVICLCLCLLLWLVLLLRVVAIVGVVGIAAVAAIVLLVFDWRLVRLFSVRWFIRTRAV